MTSFEFIKGKYPQLFELATDAERYASIDHSVFVLKIRQFLEIWAHEIDYIHSHALALEESLFEKLNRMEKWRYVNAETITIAHNLRTLGNLGVHVGFDEEQGFRHTVTLTGHDKQEALIGLHRLCLALLNDEDLARHYGYEPSTTAVIDSIVAAAFWGDAEKCLRIAQQIHSNLKDRLRKPDFTVADLQFWLEKSLAKHYEPALEFTAKLAFERSYSLFDFNYLERTLEKCFRDIKTEKCGEERI
ncbi:hypothetical protein [Aliidiomarina celeris]|uniref:hypothetical protein n=1 Tax=Aliidiomarina celeris TaxID=2249428 RepID=UPI000DEAF3A0|nr:hypothetical protein [Aliidiomarina celeris]